MAGLLSIIEIFRGEKKMSNNQKNDRNEARHLMASGMAMIAVSLLLGIFLVMMGCSGGHKKLPTDPAGSKPADSDTLTDRGTIGELNDGQISDNGMFRENALGPEFEWAVSDLFQIWERGQDGQAGGALSGMLVCGVFDSETRFPIEGAFVSVGASGDFVGETEVEGLVGILGEFVDVDPGVPSPIAAVNFYITAGADGYELESFNNLSRNVFVFFLDPLTPTPPETATVSGTVDFNTDDFYAEVYASNMVSFTDGILAPSGPGIEEDDFEIQVEAETDGVIALVMRDSGTNEIQYFSVKQLNQLSAGESCVLTGEFTLPGSTPGQTPTEPIPTGSNDTLTWTAYGALASNYLGVVRLARDTTIDDINNMTASMQFFDMTKDALPMTDIMQWETKTGPDYTYQLFRTTYLPNCRYIPYSSILCKVDVEYNDGSGTLAIVDMGNDFQESGTVNLIHPPTIEAPLDGAVAVGLIPDIEWLFYSEEENSPGAMTIIDTVNGNRWKVHLTTFARTPESQLPALPVEMSGFGLTEGNAVQAMIELESNIGSTMAIGGTTVTTPNVDLQSENYSAICTFTP